MSYFDHCSSSIMVLVADLSARGPYYDNMGWSVRSQSATKHGVVMVE